MTKKSMPVPFFMKPSMEGIKKSVSSLKSGVSAQNKEKSPLQLLVTPMHLWWLVCAFMVLGILFFMSGFICGVWVSHSKSASLKDTKYMALPQTSFQKRKTPPTKKRAQTQNPGIKNNDMQKNNAYIVQFGSFSTKENAEDLKERLQERNTSVFIKEQIKPGKGRVYDVVSEVASSFEAASTMANTMRKTAGLAVIVLPYQKEEKAA